MTTSDNCTVQRASSLFLLLPSVISTHSRLTEQFHKAKQEQNLWILACKWDYQQSWKLLILKKSVYFYRFIRFSAYNIKFFFNWMQVYIHSPSPQTHTNKIHSNKQPNWKCQIWVAFSWIKIYTATPSKKSGFLVKLHIYIKSQKLHFPLRVEGSHALLSMNIISSRF